MEICVVLPWLFLSLVLHSYSVSAEAKTTCLGYFMTPSCQPTYFITINSLNYGVSTCGGSCCPAPSDCTRTVQGIQPSEYSAIMSKCSGKTSCNHQVPASNVDSLFTVCPGTADKAYITIDFTCEQATTTTQPPTTTAPTTVKPPTPPYIPPNKPKTTTPSQTTTPAGGDKNTTQQGITEGAIIGIVVGVVCLIIIIAVIIVIVLRKRRKREKPQRAQFPPNHQGGSSAVPVHSGRDDIYGFLPGANAEPDPDRAKRTSAFLKQNQANGEANGKNKDGASVAIKNETKGGKKKSSGKSDSKNSAYAKNGSRPLSSDVSPNRTVPNVLAPGERRSRPTEVVVKPQYDQPRKSRNIPPSDNKLDKLPDIEKTKENSKTESPKSEKKDSDYEKLDKKKVDSSDYEKPTALKEEKPKESTGVKPDKTKQDSKNTQQDNKLGSSVPKQTKSTGAKPKDKTKTSSENKKPSKGGKDKKDDSKKLEVVHGVHNPAFDTGDHNSDDDEFGGSASKSSC